MRWIVSDEEFTSVFLEAQTCVFIDSHREQTLLVCLNFCDVEIFTKSFILDLHKMMMWSGDATAFFVVLRPDPVEFFHRHFNKYPAFEITSDDSGNDYLAALNEDPGGSPADAIGTNWWTCVIAPHSLKWFIHVMRSDTDDTGHLWIPKEWVQALIELRPWLKPNTF
jgi:hypothetical protein